MMLPDVSADHCKYLPHTHPFPALLIDPAYNRADMEGAFEFFPTYEKVFFGFC